MTARHVPWIERDRSPATTLDRRLLLLSAAFPPRTEVGAARWEGFAPFLEDAGWGLDVLIEDPIDLPVPDYDRHAHLPSGVRVATYAKPAVWWHQALLKARAALPSSRTPVGNTANRAAPVATSVGEHASGARALMRSLITAMVTRTQSVGAARAVYEESATVITPQHVAVISSGPPHYVHWSAYRIAKQFNLPHVVDLRDPWVNATPKEASAARVLDPELSAREATVLRNASLVITNTDAAARVLRERYPSLADRTVAIPNGSDLAPQPRPVGAAPAQFRIVHSGSLYLDRDPRPFLRAVAEARAQLDLRPDDLRVIFMGPPVRVEGRSLDEWAAAFGIGEFVEVRAAGSRDEARRLLESATMTVAFQGATPTQIPAKVFEYVAYPAWLLALVGTTSSTAQLLEGSDAIVLDIDNTPAIAASITRCINAYRASGFPNPVGADGRFSRAHQARELIGLIDRMTHSSKDAR